MMRSTLLVLSGLCAATIALAQQPEPAPGSSTQTAGRFDGAWNVTLDCPPHKEDGGAKGYSFRFLAQVKDGVLHGESGIKGAPNWLTLDGTIERDGTAEFNARGLTGDPDYSVDRVPKSTPYGYRVKARFEGPHGTGTRTYLRTCYFDFIKQ